MADREIMAKLFEVTSDDDTAIDKTVAKTIVKVRPLLA